MDAKGDRIEGTGAELNVTKCHTMVCRIVVMRILVSLPTWLYCGGLYSSTFCLYGHFESKSAMLVVPVNELLARCH